MTFAPVSTGFTLDNSSASLTTHSGSSFVVAVFLTKLARTPVVSNVSSTNCTWTQLVAPVTGVNSNTAGSIWIGKVTAVSTATVTVTWTGTTPTTWQADGHEFSSTVGSWSLDKSGSIDITTSNTAYASLTPAASGELYFGSHFDNSGAVAGATTGYTYTLDSHGNGYAFDAACTASAQAPTWGDATVQFGLMALIQESAPATATQTSRPVYTLRRNYPAATGGPVDTLIPQGNANRPIPPIHENPTVIPQSYILRAAPYPLNITTKLRPQFPATIPGVFVNGLPSVVSVQALQGSFTAKIPGIAAVDAVTANVGVVKESVTSPVAAVTVQAFPGSVSIRAVTHIQNAFPPVKPFPLSIIGQAKALVPQHPASIAKTFVTGLVASATVTANFGALKTSLTGNVSAISAVAPFGGDIDIPQTTTLPTHGWPYFSRKYFVAQSKPNVYLTNSTATVAVQSPTGITKSSIAGIISNVSAASTVGSFFIFQAQAKQNPFPRYSPYPLGLRSVLPQHAQFPQPVSGTIPGLTGTVNAVANIGTVKNTQIGLTAAVNTVANTGQIFVFIPVTKANPFAAVTPYPLYITNRGLRVTSSYIPSLAPASVNISGLTANVAVRASAGLIAIVSPYSKPFPFTNAPYPLNIISRLRPQNPASRPVVAIPGLKANVSVSGPLGSQSESITGHTSVISAVANTGILKTSVTEITAPVNVQALTGSEIAGSAFSPYTQPLFAANTIYPLIYKIRQQRPASKPNVYVQGLTASIGASAGGMVTFDNFENGFGTWSSSPGTPVVVNITQEWSHSGSSSMKWTGNGFIRNTASLAGAGVYQFSCWLYSPLGSIVRMTALQVNTRTFGAQPASFNVTLPAGVPTYVSFTNAMPADMNSYSVFFAYSSGSQTIYIDDFIVSRLSSTTPQVYITSNLQQQFPFAIDAPWPLPIIGSASTIRPQHSQAIPTAISASGITATVVVRSLVGTTGLTVSANGIVIVQGYPGSSSITGAPVYSWGGKLMKPATGKLYTNIRYNPR